MDTNTILIIVNLILTLIIAPIISIIENTLKRISKCKSCLGESTLSRENSPVDLKKEFKKEDIDDIIKRLSVK